MFLPCYECSGTEAPHQGRRDKLEHESFVTACHSLPRATSLNYTKQTTRKGARSLKTTFPNTQKKKKIKKGCVKHTLLPFIFAASERVVEAEPKEHRETNASPLSKSLCGHERDVELSLFSRLGWWVGSLGLLGLV